MKVASVNDCVMINDSFIRMEVGAQVMKTDPEKIHEFCRSLYKDTIY